MVSEGAGAAFSVALGNGDGTFQPPVEFPVVSSVHSVAVTDMNDDGLLDVVSSIPTGVVVRLNTGTAALFGPAAFYGASPTPDGEGVTTGDLTGDGIPDVVQAGQTSRLVIVYPNNGDGTLGTAFTIDNGARAGDVAVGDFDHDGKLDVAATRVFMDSVAVYRGNGDGTLQSYVSYPVAGPGSITAVDFDRDGNTDLALSLFTSSRVAVLPGDGAGDHKYE